MQIVKRGRKTLIAVAGAVGVVILVGVVWHYQLRSATEAYIAQLKAEGEPMDLAAVVPPTVSPENNGADLLRQTGTLLETNTSFLATNDYIPAMKMVGPGKAMVGWQQPDVRDTVGTNSWQEVGDAIAQDQQIFALLHQIIDKPDFDFQIPYSRGVSALDLSKSELAHSKEAAQWLSSAAVYHLHAGDTASAVDDVRAILALAQGLRDERFVISELVRIAIAHIAVGATWEILQSPAVNDAQLAQLQKDWAGLDFARSGENALAMERVTGRITLAQWRASSSKFARDLDKGRKAFEAVGLTSGQESFWTTVTMRPKIFIWEHWWSYPDELRSLKGYQVLLTSMRMAQTNGLFAKALDWQGDKLFEMRFTPEEPFGFFSPNPDFHSLISGDIRTLGVLISRVMAVDVAKQAVTTAIALKRYQLKHGNYPPNLDALVPEFLSAVPLDPASDGEPLRYHPKSDGTYLLYSVGPNGKDDGGNPALEKFVEGGNGYWLNNHALDWVWPQPVAAAGGSATGNQSVQRVVSLGRKLRRSGVFVENGQKKILKLR